MNPEDLVGKVAVLTADERPLLVLEAAWSTTFLQLRVLCADGKVDAWYVDPKHIRVKEVP